jgi:hypothetical protein
MKQKAPKVSNGLLGDTPDGAIVWVEGRNYGWFFDWALRKWLDPPRCEANDWPSTAAKHIS